MALAERSNELRVLCWLQGVLAEADLLAQRPASAHARLAPLLERIRPEASYLKETYPLVAWAELEVGEVAQAQARLEGIITLARKEGMRLTLAEALRVQALAWSRQERWAEAEVALEEALALCRAMATPFAEAKTLYACGRLSQAKGEPEQARDQLEAALTILNRLGEQLYGRQVEQALARKGAEE